MVLSDIETTNAKELNSQKLDSDNMTYAEQPSARCPGMAGMPVVSKSLAGSGQSKFANIAYVEQPFA
eukprot:7817499-Karenia_brevis.AAC.1